MKNFKKVNLKGSKLKVKQKDEGAISIATNNFFIDTSVFESNNFLHSTSIRALFNYSTRGIINLFITSITLQEIKDRIAERIKLSQDTQKKFINSFDNKELRILKNLKAYESINVTAFQKFSTDKAIDEIISKFNLNIKTSRINIISVDNVNPEEVFKLYFSNKPPFSPGKKKFEFPDAFVIKSLEGYCSVNKIKMYVLSHDKDFNGYKNNRLVIRNDIKEILEKITEYYDQKTNKKLLPKIIDSLNTQKFELLVPIKQMVLDKIQLQTEVKEINSFEMESINFKSFQIISMRDSYAEIEYLAEVSYKYLVFPSDIDFKEEFFEDRLTPKRKSVIFVVPVDLEIEYTNIKKVRIKWLNNQDPLIIKI